MRSSSPDFFTCITILEDHVVGCPSGTFSITPSASSSLICSWVFSFRVHESLTNLPCLHCPTHRRYFDLYFRVCHRQSFHESFPVTAGMWDNTLLALVSLALSRAQFLSSFASSELTTNRSASFDLSKCLVLYSPIVSFLLSRHQELSLEAIHILSRLESATVVMNMVVSVLSTVCCFDSAGVALLLSFEHLKQ